MERVEISNLSNPKTSFRAIAVIRHGREEFCLGAGESSVVSVEDDGGFYIAAKCPTVESSRDRQQRDTAYKNVLKMLEGFLLAARDNNLLSAHGLLSEFKDRVRSEMDHGTL